MSIDTAWPLRKPFACGFYCFPAFEHALEGATCDHPKEMHYDIDGEAVGCMICEEETSL